MVASNRKIRDVLGWQPRHDDLEFIVRTAWHWEQRLHACGGPAAFDRSLAAAPSSQAAVR
jgi:UDP-glucose 4-epimerase